MIYDRYKKALDYIGLKQIPLSSKLGVPLNEIKNMSSKKKKVTPEFALLLEDKFNINPVWLIFGRGEMIFTQEDQNLLEETEKSINELVPTLVDEINKMKIKLSELDKKMADL